MRPGEKVGDMTGDHRALAHAFAGGTGTIEHVLVAGSDVRSTGVDLRALCAAAPDPAAARASLARRIR